MKKIITLSVSTLLLAASAFTPALAKNFPERPIEVIVPFAAGGTTDIYSRAFSRVIHKYLPNEQRIIIVNKAGGASTIGMSAVAAADPDGYTIGILPTSVIEVQPHYGRTDWTLDDFKPVMGFLEIPASINVHVSSPIKDYADWKAFVTENPNKFTYATAGGTGSDTHLSMERVSRATGLKIRHIPFEGSAQGHSAVMSGQVMGNFSLPDVHNGGEIRPIVFLTDVKPMSDVYKDIPSAAEVGIDFSSRLVMGIVAPKDTPDDRVQVIHDAFQKALDDPEMIKFFSTLNMPIIYRNAQEFSDGMQERSKANKEMLKVLGLIKS